MSPGAATPADPGRRALPPVAGRAEPVATDGPKGDTLVRWRVLALLFGLSFVAYVVRTNLSVAAKYMMPELGISEIQMGWVFGAFTFAYAAFQFPGGIAGEWLGSRRALVLLAVAWAALTLATGWAPGQTIFTGSAGLGVLLLLRFTMGLVQAPFYPAYAGAVAAWFPRAGWALPNALGSTGLALGAAATSPVVAWLMVTVGWRASFYWTAPLALAAAGAWWWYARDTPAEHRGVGAAERAWIEAGRHDPPSPPMSKPRVWRQLLRNRETLLLALSYFCMNYVFYIFFSWLYLYLVDVRKFSVLEGGVLGALPWLIGAAAAALGGWACDHLCARIGPRWGCRLPCVVGLVLVAFFLVAGATAGNPYLAVLYLALCFGSTQLTEGAYWAGCTFVAGEHTAAASGILNTGGNLGGVVSSPLIPVLVAHFGWLPALLTGSAFALLGAILWLFIDVERPLGAQSPA